MPKVQKKSFSITNQKEADKFLSQCYKMIWLGTKFKVVLMVPLGGSNDRKDTRRISNRA